MPDNGAVIITGKLDDTELTKSIDKLVDTVDKKLGKAAETFENNIGRMNTALHNFTQGAKNEVNEIRTTFSAMGTAFDTLRKAIEKAANAWAASNGTGAGSWSGGTKPPSAPGTIGELKEQIAKQKELLDAEKQHTAELQKKVNLLRQMEDSLRRQTTSTEKMRQQAVGMNLRNINSIVPTNTTEAENKLNRLKRLFENLQTSVRNLGVNKFDFLPESMWNRIQASIKRTEKQLDNLRQKSSKPIMPKDMTGVMGMSEKTLDQIAFKMKAISELRAKTPIDSADISRLNGEYARLSKLQTEILGKNAALVESNNALGRAFNYIRNRLAFTLTIGAFTGFVRQLYEIRGQYELLERSLGVLLDSFSKGSQIFNELNAMAIQSPFTLIELGTAAKQLTAYNFKANEVVDTTRRLADISAALGVPMERLVYNLGQIRAQTVLTARDARDFANAGLAIVPELAKYYTELQGKVVSTADVFDMMKKKAVSYNDVMSVLYKITDEGGKFFDFQAKQAGTLKVQLANLNLAWNNMLNDMGKSNQGLLSFPVQGLREMFMHWRDISDAITLAVGALGAYKLAQFAISKVVGVSNAALVRSAQAEARANMTRLQRIQLTRQLTQEEQVELAQSRFLIASKQSMNKADYENMLAKVKLSKVQASQLVTMNKHNIALREALISTGTLTQAEVANAMAVGKWSLMFKRAMISLRAFGLALKSILLTPTTGIMLLVAIAADIASTWMEASQAVKEFNNELAKNSKESYDNLSKFLSSYSSSIGKTLSVEEAEKTWEAMREEIIQSSSAGQGFVAKLEQIDDVNQRIKEGFNYVSSIQAVHGALQEIDSDVIKIQEDWSKWWNLGLGNDSMMENLDQYIEYLKKVGENYEKAISQGTAAKGRDPFATISDELETLRGNLDETAKSMVDFFTNKNFTPEQEREGFNKVVDEMVSKYNMGVEQSLHFRMELERSYQKERLLLYEKENSENSQNLYRAWNKDFGNRQALEDEFLKWLSRNHRSEVQAMFGNMTKEEIAHINWSEPKWKWWAINNAQEFSRQYNLSFNDLRYLVNSANKMSVRIPVFFDFVNTPKSIYDTLTEADQAANSAYQTYQRLQERLNQLRSQGKQKTKEYTDTENEATAALKKYNEEVAKGGKSKSAEAAASKRANAANKANAKARREQAKAESELQKALRDELQVIDKVQAAYKKLTKAGVSRDEALGIATSGFESTAKNINNVLKKYGIAQFDIKKFAGLSNPREMLKMLENQLAKIKASGKSKPVEIKELEAQIDKIRVDAKEYDMKRITDGLNNELGKIKEEYELAVELDANPELGDMFADMFGIDVDELPHTFGEAYDRANKVAIEKLKELQADVKGFDLMSINIENFAKNQGLEMDSQPIQDLMKLQQTWRDMFKKNITETEKYLDDYVKKYGNMSDKIAEIEADRLNKIKQLNEAYYTEQMRKMPEYTAKLNAINKGAEREKGGVRFDEFKNSRLYVTMFENLQYVSTATLETIRQKLAQLKSEMGTLTPEQLKQVVQQFEKIDNELRNRSPFKGLLKNYHDYIKANGKAGKQAEKDLVVAQENYDKQMQVVTALKEQLVQEEAKEKKDWERIANLRILIALENDKLKSLDEELQKAIELNEQYNLMKKAFGDQWQQIGKLAQTVSTNLKSLGELRDYLKDAGVDFGDAFDGVVDSLQGVSEGMNQIVSSATSGDVFGVVTGTIKTVFGIGDAIASIFGGGAARTRRINREIKKSQEEVRRLNMAYKDLERTVNKAMGSQEIAAQRALIANKKAEKAEIERQLRLEKSKRSKDRDEDAIKQYEETLQSLKHEIEDLGDSIVENLLGNNVKSAAEDFVDTWVSAWKQGENTLDAIEGKMDEITQNLIKKAVASKLVGTLLQPFYDAVDNFASETSEGGVAITMNELQILSAMLQTLGVNINDVLTGLYNNLESIGIISKGTGATELSNLQQGISAMSESTAEALLAYWNANTQQQYVQSDLLMQIRDIVALWSGDVQIATQAQILLQLQMSYSIQMSIQETLSNWSSASGLAVRVELAN